MKKPIRIPSFEGVDDGGVRIPPGDYRMRCTGCEKKNAITSGDPMIVFTFVGMEGKAKGKTFLWYCPLAENVRWKLKQALKTLGVETPDPPDEMDLDPDDVEGIEVTGYVEDHTYNGITSSKLVGIAATDEDSTPVKKLPKLSSPDVEEMDEDELEDVAREYKLDVDLSGCSRKGMVRIVKQALDKAGLLDPE